MRIALHEHLDGLPDTDLACEELLVRRASDGVTSLFLYSWRTPVLVIGYGQDPAGVDLAACHRLSVPVRRRISGGTGVLHDRDLAVSLALPASHPWARSIQGLYDRMVDALSEALRRSGVSCERPPADARPGKRRRSPICFNDLNGETLLVDGRKAVGCAQARRRDAVLVHAAMLLGLDPALQAQVYGVSTAEIASAMAPIRIPQVELDRLPGRVTDAVCEALGLPPSRSALPPLPPDLAARYSDRYWAPA